jgi:uncharacterized repeat protein (TIGR01451 family)
MECSAGLTRIFSCVFRQLLLTRPKIKHNVSCTAAAGVAWLLLIGAAASGRAVAQTTSFGYTGAVQTYTVPAGAAGVAIQLAGGGGGGGGSDSGGAGATGGSGATVTGNYTVAAGTSLSIYVGGGGGGGFTSHGTHTCTNAAGTAGGSSGSGGFAGGMGGEPGCSGWSGGGGGGGGASVLATSTNAPLLVAGGGGGGQGGSLNSSSVPSLNSTLAGSLPATPGGTGLNEPNDGGGGGGGGGGCPGGVSGDYHADSTGSNYNTPAGAGASCFSAAQITGFAILATPGGAGGAGAPAGGTNIPPGAAGSGGSISLTPFYIATVLASASFPAAVNAGQTVTGTITFTDSGPSPATGNTYTITLPANLVTAPTLSGLPNGASYTYTASTGGIGFTGMPATLGIGASVGPITVNYTQLPSASSTVSAMVTTATTDPNPAAGSVTVTIGGSQVATVVSAASFPATVNAGLSVSGTVTFSNSGPSTSTGDTYSLTLPANLTSAPTLAGLPNGVTYTYAPATGLITLTGMPTTVLAGASLAPITVNYVQPPSGTSTLSATMTTQTLDPNVAKGTVTITVTGAASELYGTVYVDNNQDQLFDAGDSPIAGATVSLYASAHLIATTQTSATGVYTFPSEPSGSFQVIVTPSSGYDTDTPASVTVTLGPGTANIINFGEIPASVVGALTLTKTTPLVNITAGQSVPYTITATNPETTVVANVTITDLIPAGFAYRIGSGMLNGVRLAPTVSGRQLTWTHLSFAAGETKTFSLVLTAGAGVVSGSYTNQASAQNSLINRPISNVAKATVQIVADPTLDCPDLIGKVFDDTNGNGIADPDEKGIAGVRLVTAQGLLVTTDAEGRYHITCPLIPDAQLGSNFIVKLDERTLPSGYRLTSENPETVRLTAGKLSKLNFGASISRVARIEVSGAAFQGETPDRAVAQQLDGLIAALKDETTIVRLSYAALAEPDALINARLERLKQDFRDRWQSRGAHATLHFEEDIVRTHGAGDAGALP